MENEIEVRVFGFMVPHATQLYNKIKIMEHESWISGFLIKLLNFVNMALASLCITNSQVNSEELPKFRRVIIPTSVAVINCFT